MSLLSFVRRGCTMEGGRVAKRSLHCTAQRRQPVENAKIVCDAVRRICRTLWVLATGKQSTILFDERIVYSLLPPKADSLSARLSQEIPLGFPCFFNLLAICFSPVSSRPSMLGSQGLVAVCCCKVVSSLKLRAVLFG